MFFQGENCRMEILLSEYPLITSELSFDSKAEAWRMRSEAAKCRLSSLIIAHPFCPHHMNSTAIKIPA